MRPHYACVRQDDQSDCGAAALATIALHHRRPIGLQRMRELAGTDRIGTNLLGLLQAAERLGFSAKAVKGPYEGLGTVPLPALVRTGSAAPDEVTSITRSLRVDGAFRATRR